MSTPLVSILLPVYNPDERFKTALDSLVNQTYSNIEIIILDDGSHPVIKKINSDSRIQWHHFSHRGLAEVLNHGIKLARGKYIARMDADDCSSQKRIEKQVNCLESYPATDLVATQVFEPEPGSGIYQYIKWQNNLCTHNDIFNQRFVDAPLVHPTIMTRSDSFKKYGEYSEENIPEDFDLWLRWLEKGATFFKIRESLLHWSDHSGRLTRTHPNYARETFFEVKARYFAKWFNESGIKSPLWICGTGTKVFKRSALLEKNGLTIEGYIDVKRTMSLRNVISYEEISNLDSPFICSYVSDWSGRIKIQKFLNNRGFQEGVNFYMMA